MAEVYVIVHPDLVGIQALSKKEIQNIYLGKKRTWLNRNRIIPAELDKGLVRGEFLEQIVGTTSRRFERYWKKLIFTGKALPLKKLENQQKLLEYVAQTPNAIGYLGKKPETDDVRVISIIGYSSQSSKK